jgi:surfeit locus 1 family protein
MSRWRALLWPTIAAAVALAILLSLGTWQLQRRGEKEAVLAALESGIEATPLPIAAGDLRRLRVLPPGRPAADGSLAELTRLTVSGTFLDGPALPVRATLPSGTRGAVTGGIGFFWMAPLRLDDGTILFVNRGFVPSGADFRPPAIRTPEGRQTIVGRLRAPEQRQLFTPADMPEKREFFIRDPATMGRALGLDPALVAPLFVDAERASATDATPPVGVDAREMIARIPNNHLQYAVTWFGLALTLIGVYAAFAVTRLRGSR